MATFRKIFIFLNLIMFNNLRALDVVYLNFYLLKLKFEQIIKSLL